MKKKTLHIASGRERTHQVNRLNAANTVPRSQGVLGMAAGPAFLTYDVDPVAEPCFRSLYWYAGDLDVPALREMATQLANWFWRSQHGQVGLVSLLTEDLAARPGPPSDAMLADVGRWLNSPGKDTASTLQMQGPEVDGHDGERIPWLNIEIEDDKVMVEVCLPHDRVDLVAAADQIAEVCLAEGLICGVQAMGYFLPPENDTLVAILPCTMQRYRCAVEIRLRDPVDGIALTGSTFFWERHPDLQPGIADIGWRTVVGAPFMPRLGKLPDMPGVTVQTAPAGVTLTAGPAPIWGDVNRGEDIAPYRAVAAVLAPLAMPREITDTRYFQGNPDNADFMERLDLYLERLA